MKPRRVEGGEGWKGRKWGIYVSPSAEGLHGHGQGRPVEVEGHEEDGALREVDQDHDHRQHHHRQRHHLVVHRWIHGYIDGWVNAWMVSVCELNEEMVNGVGVCTTSE